MISKSSLESRNRGTCPFYNLFLDSWIESTSACLLVLLDEAYLAPQPLPLSLFVVLWNGRIERKILQISCRNAKLLPFSFDSRRRIATNIVVRACWLRDHRVEFLCRNLWLAIISRTESVYSRKENKVRT